MLTPGICFPGHLEQGNRREVFPGFDATQQAVSHAANLELRRKKQLLIAAHTRRYLREEITFPGAVIDRANREQWREAGQLTLRERAAREVARIVAAYQPSRLPEETKRELTRLMRREAQRHGMESLPTGDE